MTDKLMRESEQLYCVTCGVPCHNCGIQCKECDYAVKNHMPFTTGKWREDATPR